MAWQDQTRGDSLTWLLEPTTPGVRYLALRDLLELPLDDPELLAARAAAHVQGPIATVLGKMADTGYWAKAGPGYGPKYRSTVWSLLLLAQLGASVEQDPRVGRACTYVLAEALAPGGQFSYNRAPGGTIDCLQGNLCWALLALGYRDPPPDEGRRLAGAFEWMARSVTGEGIAPAHARDARRQDAGLQGAALRYYAYKCGPGFACGANNKQPCAWGATKVMLALGQWPAAERTPLIEAALRQGAEFLLGTDPAEARYPSGENAQPSGNWWKFGFPVFYVTDILQIVEALLAAGYGQDPRLAGALALIRDKQDAQGRWALEYDYTGKTWVGFGPKKQPNKWVTLRALRVLKATAD